MKDIKDPHLGDLTEDVEVVQGKNSRSARAYQAPVRTSLSTCSRRTMTCLLGTCMTYLVWTLLLLPINCMYSHVPNH